MDKKKERKFALMDQKSKTIAGLAEALALEVPKAELAEDVVVRWKNIFDAEYSESWPEQVIHDAMPEGIRYTAPPPEGEGKDAAKSEEVVQL